MKILLILNNEPYNGSDVAYNALRLAKTLFENNNEVRIFLMNDSVDLARECNKKPQNYDVDLVDMLKKLYKSGVQLKVCGSCQARCGIYKNEPYFDENIESTMKELASWVEDSDKVMTF
jgi:uncharacterized protein involved in oxidation of intracellular sulfur